MTSPTLLVRRALSILLVTALALTAAVIAPFVSNALETPVEPALPLPQTVSADALPTVQIDGVVWRQVIVGNTVYAAGSFQNARPAGAAPGTSLTPRANMLAYNLTTGALITSFAPAFNNQVKDLAVSPDGKRLYAVGSFTQVDGQVRNRVATFDLPSGTLSSFAPNVNSVVQSVAATNTTLYVGGYFGSVNGVYRPRVAAVNAQTGSVLPFAPQVDNNQVQAIVVAPDEKSVVIGGNFTSVGGSSEPGYGLARLSSDTGSMLSLPVNAEARDAGPNSGVISLSSDGTSFYGSGWVYGQGGNMEGAFSANWSDGALKWIEDCHGDTYGVYPAGGVVYEASHKHYCGNSGGFPQTTPWSFHHSTAVTPDVRGTNTSDIYGYPDHPGKPRPQFLNWYPVTDVGTYTGKSQAVWTVTGNSQYVVYGGEFPKVNGVGQQGLVRYAVKSLAPNKQGPKLSGAKWNPSVLSVAAGKVRLAFKSNYDLDDTVLTYRVFRDSETAAPISQQDIDTSFWQPVTKSLVDAGLVAGSSHRYRVTATDPYGNVAKSEWVSVTVSSAAPSDYTAAVTADQPTNFWRLGETSPTTAFDWAGADDLAVNGAVTRGAAGAINGDSDGASTFDGQSSFAATQTPVAGPDVFSEEAWFKTTSTTGGKIVSFGDQKTGNSNNYDRHIYMDPSGQVWFGVYNNGMNTVNTSKALNDGQWHHAVGTMDGSGVTLYVDGKRVGHNGGTASAQPYSGYWRIGGDSSWSGNPYFNGDIDDVAIYPTALTLAQVQAHYTDSGRTVDLPAKPADTYGRAVYANDPDLYWRLGESGGTTAKDATQNEFGGVYNGGVTYGANGAVTGTNDTAVTFNGSDGAVASASTVTNPTVYSEELWFNTTTTQGGKLIGFGSNQSGGSGGYDRHVYMFDDGRLRFGVWTGQPNVIDSPLSYNDGKWHHMVATQGPDGMTLYVDGVLVGTNPQTQAQDYTGYWRVGGDTTWGGNSSNYFAGSIDEVAIYSSALSAADVVSHFKAGGGSLPNQAPAAAFTSSSTGLKASFDASGSTDADGTVASYAWDFGDESAAGTDATPTHTYAAAGTYTVSLTVTDDKGATNVKTDTVTVTNAAPTAAFTSSATALAATFDGTGSSDTDGSIASYAWNFGDGATATDASPGHTYAAGGSYDVTLTVTDNAGGTATVTHSLTVAKANVPPTAAFTSSPSDLAVAFDGSASADSDGTVASYAWDFGDGAFGTDANPSHTYAAGGSYTVKLTVTDDRGVTDSATHTVMLTAPNKAPTAAFTSTTTDLAVAFDASTSADPDGTIRAYAWDFGDDTAAGSGSSPRHVYLAAGTYQVKLTVTDDQGGTDSVTRAVTVVAASVAFVKDSFSRSLSGAWGTSDLGGLWTLSGGNSYFSANGTAGTISIARAGLGPKAQLQSVSQSDLEVQGSMSLDKIADGGGTYVSLTGRTGGFSSEYRAKVWVKSTGAVGLIISAVQSSETTLAQVNVPGLTVAAGDTLRVRFQIQGSSPTTLRAKVWKAGATEPQAWGASATDATAQLQDAGGVGIATTLSGSATTGATSVKLDDLWAGPIGSAP